MAFTWKCVLFTIATIGYTLASKWYRDPSFDNKVSQSGCGLTSRSLIHCADACASNSSCMSFFFIKGQLENCKIQSEILTPCSPGLIAVSGSTYYVMEFYPPFSCPPDDTVFRTVRLSDNSHFTYRVFKTLKNQTYAKASCVSEGGFLARATTVAKMNMLLTLTNCAGYSAINYWVDGSNDHSGPTWDSWIMSTNEPVPMSTEFWGVGRPNHPDTEHCIRMDVLLGHMWNDDFCSTMYFYICEKC